MTCVGTSPGNPKRPTFEEVAAVGRAILPPLLLKLRVQRQDVDDLLQDTLIEVGRALDRFDPGYHPGRDEGEALRSWLWGFGCLAARQYHRHMRGEIGESFDALPSEPADEAPSSEQLAADEQRRRLVAEVLATLPDADTEVLVPFYFGGMKSVDIAAGAGVDHNTLRGRLVRARARFRAAAGELPEDERSLLEDGVLLVPLGLGLEGGGDAPGTRGPGAPVMAAGALAMLVLGVAVEARWGKGSGSVVEALPAVTAVREAPTGPRGEATGSAAVASIPSARAAPAAVKREERRGSMRIEDGGAEEKALIKAARRARDAGAYELSLVNLAAHEREFPDGALAQERERLRGEVRAAMEAGAPSL
jgi:RNA polymerase sigma factor (sigma-70 family)